MRRQPVQARIGAERSSSGLQMYRSRPGWTRMRFTSVLVALCLIVTGCSPDTRPLAGESVASDIVSGGLGLTRVDWEKRHGQGVKSTSSSAVYAIAGHVTNVVFTGVRPGTSQRVSGIQVTLRRTSESEFRELGLSLPEPRPDARSESLQAFEARQLGVSLVPSDAVPQSRGTSEFRGVLTDGEDFTSETLERLFDDVCVRKPASSDNPAWVGVSLRKIRGEPDPFRLDIGWNCPQYETG